MIKNSRELLTSKFPKGKGFIQPSSHNSVIIIGAGI